MSIETVVIGFPPKTDGLKEFHRRHTPHRIKSYFDSTSMERPIRQTRTRKVGVTQMLDNFVPVAETRYIEDPDAVSRFLASFI